MSSHVIMDNVYLVTLSVMVKMTVMMIVTSRDAVCNNMYILINKF